MKNGRGFNNLFKLFSPSALFKLTSDSFSSKRIRSIFWRDQSERRMRETAYSFLLLTLILSNAEELTAQKLLNAPDIEILERILQEQDSVRISKVELRNEEYVDFVGKEFSVITESFQYMYLIPDVKFEVMHVKPTNRYLYGIFESYPNSSVILIISQTGRGNYCFSFHFGNR